MTTLNEPRCKMCGHRALDFLLPTPANANWPHPTYGEIGADGMCGICRGKGEAEHMPTNGDKATRAEVAVLAHAAKISEDVEMEDEIKDLLSNLMHLCRREEYDFGRLLESARANYVDEMNASACEVCGYESFSPVRQPDGSLLCWDCNHDAPKVKAGGDV